jgi:hypothetical protein
MTAMAVVSLSAPAVAAGLPPIPGQPVADPTAAPHEPPDGTILSGVSVESDAALASFLRATGQKSVAVTNQFLAPSDPGWWLGDLFRRRGTAGMVSWAVFGTSAEGSLARVADGGFDARIITHAAALRSAGVPLFERIDYEQTGFWFPWSGYDAAGRPRPGNTPLDYVNHWRRIRILYDGGPIAFVNARLLALGLPPVTTAATVLSHTDVALVWSTGFPNPGVAADGHRITNGEWYPGDGYVDWVSVDHYAQQGWTWSGLQTRDQGLDDVYEEFAIGHRKPMMFAEWGVTDADHGGTADDGQWVNKLLEWSLDHPKVKAQFYFNIAAADGDHRLEGFPRAAAAFRSATHRPGWITSASAVP